LTKVQLEKRPLNAQVVVVVAVVVVAAAAGFENLIHAVMTITTVVDSVHLKLKLQNNTLVDK